MRAEDGAALVGSSSLSGSSPHLLQGPQDGRCKGPLHVPRALSYREPSRPLPRLLLKDIWTRASWRTPGNLKDRARISYSPSCPSFLASCNEAPPGMTQCSWVSIRREIPSHLSVWLLRQCRSSFYHCPLQWPLSHSHSGALDPGLWVTVSAFYRFTFPCIAFSAVFAQAPVRFAALNRQWNSRFFTLYLRREMTGLPGKGFSAFA